MDTLIEELPDLDEGELAAAMRQAEAEAAEEEDDEQLLVALSEEDEKFYENIILRIMIFLKEFTGRELFPYQKQVAYRVIESVLINDGETITVEQSRQSGKSEVLANVIAVLMVLLPRLAKAFPNNENLAKFADGFWVGVFAPTDEQADTVWGRIVDRLCSEVATKMFLDPELEDKVTKTGGKSKCITLRKSGSFCRRQTCNPKAKIESKSYHFVLIDECQDADSFVVDKSIGPMLAFYNGSRVYTGTPSREKNVFYKAIQQNKRRQVRRGVRQCHYSYDYKFVCKYNPNYRKFIAKEKARLGEDSDEFQLSYCCKWLIDQGMFVTEDKLMTLADPSMKTYSAWTRSPVVVGIDPARKKDSTVVTVMWVDWDRPDAHGFCEHRILDWLELHNQEFERQYMAIASFLNGYRIRFIGVDSQGMGMAVYERLKLMFMDICEVVECPSDAKSQAERWRYLKQLIEREALVFPAHPLVKRRRTWKKFVQQMTDLETKFQGPHMLAAAPEEANAHDDYADSCAIAAFMSSVDVLEEAESSTVPWANRRR